MVFQEPYDSLSPRMRIGRQIAEPLRMLRDLSTAERYARVVEAFEMVRSAPARAGALSAPVLGRRAAHRYRPGAGHPADLIVLDEPTSALDVSVRPRSWTCCSTCRNASTSRTC